MGHEFLPQHVADLARSGIMPAQAFEAGFRSVTDMRKVADVLGCPPEVADRFSTCLAILYGYNPATNKVDMCLDDSRRRIYCRFRPDRPRVVESTDAATGRVRRRVVKYESIRGLRNRPFILPAVRAALTDPTVPLILTEGEKKILAAVVRGFFGIGLVGVDGWSLKRTKGKDGRPVGPRKLLPELAAVAWTGRVVNIVYDSDAVTNRNVRRAEQALAAALVAAGADVRIVRLPGGPDGAKQGLDDFLVARGPDALRSLLDAAGPVTNGGGAVGTRPADRPVVFVTPDQYLANDFIAGVIGRDRGLYQRAGQLVQVLQVPAGTGVIERPAGPRLRSLPVDILREAITRQVRLEKVPEKGEPYPVDPPDWLVRAVYWRGDWPGVRPLTAVVDHPVVQPDGRVLAAPGYDPDTGLFLWQGDLALAPVPDTPTLADAVAARDALLEVVADIEFPRAVDRAAWLAALLTVVGRFAFPGPAPLTLFDGNTPGCGKGLCVSAITAIASGHPAATTHWTADDDEMRKRITSLAREGDRVALLDNLDRPLGGAALDMALTTTRWKDRILGKSEQVELPLYTVWFATGNNVTLAGDMRRRVLWVRIRTAHANPEDRAGFRHPQLLEWVATNRPRLLAAALTLLSGYLKAGRPAPAAGLPAWGSYEGWSAVVRGAVVWVGLPDPREAAVGMRDQADPRLTALATLVDQWNLLGEKAAVGLTAQDIWAATHEDRPELADLRSAVEALAGTDPDAAAVKLGYALRGARDRVFAGGTLAAAKSLSG